jgi:hypothetical protein
MNKVTGYDKTTQVPERGLGSDLQLLCLPGIRLYLINSAVVEPEGSTPLGPLDTVLGM